MKAASAILTIMSIVSGISAIFFLPGCAGTQVESRLQKDLDSLGIAAYQLRVTNLERAGRFGMLIQSATDSIITASDVPSVRRHAAEWRMSVIPLYRLILFFADPAAASLDGWAFTVQMRQFFTVGNGSELFGDQQSIAVRTVRTIEKDFSYTGDDSSALEKFRRMEVNAEKWAERHPIQNSFYGRQSVVPFLHEFQLDIDEGLAGTIANISHDVRSISARIDLLAAQLPREARWQAEYMVEDLDLTGRIDRLERDLTGITASLERLTDLIEENRLTIDIKSLRSLHADILHLEERIAIERGLVLADIERQRIETLERIDVVAERILGLANTHAVDLIDYLLWRVALLIVICVILAVAAVFVFRFVLYRRPA